MPKLGYFFTFFLLSTVYCLLSNPILANQGKMSSSNYQIIFGNINSGGSTAQSGTGAENYQLDISLGQTLAKKFTSDGYIVKTGFQYIHNLVPFYFQISDISIDFGVLTPNTLTDRTFNLEVSQYGSGYEIEAIADHQMQTQLATAEIPATFCNGTPECTIAQAQLWDSSSAYGFGYRVTGHDRPADFALDNYFRPFATLNDNNYPVNIMASSGITEIDSTTRERLRRATVTLRLNVSVVQPAGNYQTLLNLIAVPRY
jgi:hypothetical protein